MTAETVGVVADTAEVTAETADAIAETADVTAETMEAMMEIADVAAEPVGLTTEADEAQDDAILDMIALEMAADDPSDFDDVAEMRSAEVAVAEPAACRSRQRRAGTGARADGRSGRAGGRRTSRCNLHSRLRKSLRSAPR